ncbi:MAG TPA: hypothetical protein VLB51_06910 [Methylomirabilota bacterium]|nr:hypothetical protein [Methylomirabilota bacterium]
MVLALLAAPGCSAPPTPAAPSDDLRVVRGQLVRRHLLTGELEAVTAAGVKVPRTPEYRLQIQRLVDDGATVSQGEVIVEFDNSAFTANLDQQRTAVQRARRSLLQARAAGDARLREAEAAAERARIALAKAELDTEVPASVRSRYEYRTFELARARAAADHAKSTADLRATTAAVESEIRIAEEQVRKAERELAVAEGALTALRLTAPRDGIAVVERNLREDRKFQVGDTVFPGWTVVAIPDLDNLRVRATLSDVDDGAIAPSLPATCTPDIEPSLRLAGRITVITPIAREQRVFSERRGFDVVVELDDREREVLLVPGMSVRVEVETARTEGLLAPRAALDLIAEPPRAHRRDGTWTDVVVGPCSSLACIVIEGLKDGDPLAPASEGTS